MSSSIWRFVGAFAVVAVSFWITLQVIDNWSTTPAPERAAAERKATPASSARTRAPIFTLVTTATNSNWAAAGPQTKLQVTGDGISLVSTAQKNFWLLQSTEVPVQKGANYLVSYDITVTEGAIAVGILNDRTGLWIVTKTIAGKKDTIAFNAPSDQIRVVLLSTESSPCEALVSSLTISPTNE